MCVAWIVGKFEGEFGKAVMRRPSGFSWMKRRRVGILNSACAARRYIAVWWVAVGEEK